MATDNIRDLSNVKFQDVPDCSTVVEVLNEEKHIFVGNRDDGKDGSGHLFDPFNGSTSTRFDAVHTSLQSLEGIDLHWNAELFQTNVITRTWAPKNGWRISGLGRNVTTLQAVGNATTENLFTIGDDDNTTNLSGVVIRDLTIDANPSVVGATATVGSGGEKNYKIGLINIGGSNTLIENVAGINPYGSAANNREAFGIRLYGSNISASVSGNTIRNCIVTSPAGNYGTPYSIHGYNDTYPQINFEFIGNKATGNNTGLHSTSGFTTGGVNLFSVAHGIVSGNFFIDCRGILYIDTGSITDVKIQGNKCIRAAQGIAITLNGGATGSYITITDNDINIQNKFASPDAASIGIIVQGGASHTHYSIGGLNHFTRDQTGSGYLEVRPIIGSFTDTTIITDVLADNCFPSIVTGSKNFNNLDETGAQAPGLENNITSNGDVSSNTSTSVVGEMVLFQDTSGKKIKRSTLTGGLLKSTSGVPAIAAAGTDYITPTGSGAGLTALNASAIGSGTVPTARLGSGTANSGTYLRGDQTWVGVSGATIASTALVLKGDNSGNAIAATLGTDYLSSASTLNASNVGSGTVANARLTSEIQRLIAASSTVSGATPNLDWSLTTKFALTLSANATLTFSNDTDGWDILIRITNTASNYTVTWPAGLKWTTGTPPTQTVGAKTDLYGFAKIGSTIFAAYIQNLS